MKVKSQFVTDTSIFFVTAYLAQVFVPIGPLIVAGKLEVKNNFPYEFYKTAPKKIVHFSEIYYLT